jgi:hypothetical protein
VVFIAGGLNGIPDLYNIDFLAGFTPSSPAELVSFEKRDMRFERIAGSRSRLSSIVSLSAVSTELTLIM